MGEGPIDLTSRVVYVRFMGRRVLHGVWANGIRYKSGVEALKAQALADAGVNDDDLRILRALPNWLAEGPSFPFSERLRRLIAKGYVTREERHYDDPTYGPSHTFDIMRTPKGDVLVDASVADC